MVQQALQEQAQHQVLQEQVVHQVLQVYHLMVLQVLVVVRLLTNLIT